MDKLHDAKVAVLSVIEPSFKVFVEQFKKTGEFDKQKFLDEMEGVKCVLEGQEIRIFDSILKTRLEVLRTLVESKN